MKSLKQLSLVECVAKVSKGLKFSDEQEDRLRIVVEWIHKNFEYLENAEATAPRLRESAQRIKTVAEAAEKLVEALNELTDYETLIYAATLTEDGFKNALLPTGKSLNDLRGQISAFAVLSRRVQEGIGLDKPGPVTSVFEPDIVPSIVWGLERIRPALKVDAQVYAAEELWPVIVRGRKTPSRSHLRKLVLSARKSIRPAADPNKNSVNYKTEPSR